MLWLLMLPFAVIFTVLCLPVALFVGLLWLPFVILRWTLKLALGLLLVPPALVALLVGGLLIVLAVSVVLLPAIPFALAGLFIWAVIRIASPARPSAAF